MKLLWTELRRSALRWWLPAFLVMDCAAIFGRSRWWIGIWPQASAAGQIPSLFFAPLLVAGAAWGAGRNHRLGLDEQFASATRRRWTLEMRQLTGTAIYGLVPYAVGMALAAAVTAPAGGPGFLWPSYVILGMSVLLGSVGVGHLVGRLFPSGVAVPIIAGLAVFIFMASMGTPEGLQLFFLDGPPQVRLAPMPLLARLLVAIALMALATVVPPIIRHRSEGGWMSRHGAAIGCAIVVTLVAAGAWTVKAGPLRVDRSAPVSPTCTTTKPQVCLWPEDRKYLPVVTTMMRRLNQVPAGIFTLPDSFYERGLRGDRLHPSDFLILEGDSWSISAGMWAAIATATFKGVCVPRDRDTADIVTHADFELGQWMQARLNGTPRPARVHGGPPGVDFAAIGRLIRAPENVQTAWVRQRIATVKGTSCV